MPLRLLGAIRLSKTTDETTSPERQELDINREIEGQGAVLVDVVRDLDVSADKFAPFKRKALGPWLNDRVHDYDGIVWAKADRAIRSMMDMHELSKWAIEHRKLIVFVKGPGKSSPRMVLDFRNGPLDPISALMVTLFAFAGEVELAAIKERNAESQALAAIEGRWHGGIPPYGYRPQKFDNGWKLVIDPPARDRIHEIVKLALDGKSLNSIASDYNKRGITPPGDHIKAIQGKEPRGGMWTSSALSVILTSKNLLGMHEIGGKVVRGNDGLPVYRAEPILTRLEWERLQVKLNANSIKRPRTTTTSPTLGVLFCILCGEPKYRSAPRGNRRECYRCRGRTFKNSGCSAQNTPGDSIMEIIESTLLEAVGDFEMYEEVFIPAESHQEELEEAEESYAYLQSEIAKKPDKLAKLLRPQIEALEKKIVVLSDLPQRSARKEYQPTGRTYRDLWQVTEPTDRRQLLLAAGVRLEVGRQDGPWVSVGRFERPERYDEAVKLGIHEGIQFAFFMPKDLIERTTGLKPL